MKSFFAGQVLAFVAQGLAVDVSADKDEPKAESQAEASETGPMDVASGGGSGSPYPLRTYAVYSAGNIAGMVKKISQFVQVCPHPF